MADALVRDSAKTLRQFTQSLQASLTYLFYSVAAHVHEHGQREREKRCEKT